MKAYTQGITKEQFVNETKAHALADNFLKGTYDKGDKAWPAWSAESAAYIKHSEKLLELMKGCK